MRDGDGDELALGEVGGGGEGWCKRGGLQAESSDPWSAQPTRRLELGTVEGAMDRSSATKNDPASARAIDITFRARQEECEYRAVSRVNPVEVRERTAIFSVDHASLIAMFRAAEPSDEEGGAVRASAAALDGIGVDHAFLVARRDDDLGAMFRDLARLALNWWFDGFERDASPITRANAALIDAVVDAALADSPQEPVKNHTALARRSEWREVGGERPLRPR
jgi:hypothetical protein